MKSDPFSRRDFLKIAAGSSAVFAGSIGQKQYYKLIPYVNEPENTKPGEWVFYSTTCRECPAGCGMLIRQNNARIVKVEAANGHPVSYNGLCPRGQSSVQGLYDPDRIRNPTWNKKDITWPSALDQIAEKLKKTKNRVVVISDLRTGSLREVINEFANTMGAHQETCFYEPFNYDHIKSANQLIYGRRIIPRYNIEKCDTVISFGADFLEGWLSNVEYAAQFASMRDLANRRMTKLFYIGPRFSMTAVNADEFINVSPLGQVAAVLLILKYMVTKGLARSDVGQIVTRFGTDAGKLHFSENIRDRLEKAAQIIATSQNTVALAGDVEGSAGAELAFWVEILNYATGVKEKAIDYSRPHALSDTVSSQEFSELIDSITADDSVIIHNANPVYSMPKAVTALRRAGLIVYIGTMRDETAEIVDVILPCDSNLEQWGDYEPWKGIHCTLQPGMGRLWDSMHPGDILIAIARTAGKALKKNGDVMPNYKLWMSRYWEDIHKRTSPNTAFEEFWHDVLRRGYVIEELEKQSPNLKANAAIKSGGGDVKTAGNDEFQLWPWQSVLLFDGRTANRGWMQEIPEPLSSVVWGNIADIHPARAIKLGLTYGDMVEISGINGKVNAPVRITDHVNENAISLNYGQGHTALGRNAKGRGANVFALLGAQNETTAIVRVRKIGKMEHPVYLYPTWGQFGREFVKWTSLNETAEVEPRKNERFVMPLPEGYDPEHDIYKPHYYKNHRWAMVIDLNRCIGCRACEAACYAENNVAVMGENPLRQGREMAWISVPLYRSDQDEKRYAFLPMLCQHCDAAPCEPVCPVFAAVHNDEGLNAQVYNRCIGTRYCSNNCPYKVRRFNWFNVEWEKPLDAQLNPEVTVRSRGVMEKCTFCIQRIRAAEYAAKREHRKVRDGEVVPACVQTCPTGVFTFGDLLDSEAKVTKLTRHDPRRYQVLAELNTKPAVAYLKRVINDT